MSEPSGVPSRSLPARPNLEQLKKQAKDLLDAYRAGDASAAAEVRKYERAPETAFLALHDAQRVLARAYGFPSWSKLRAHVEGVTVARFTAAVLRGDLAGVRAMLRRRPELLHMEGSEGDERMAIHHAVLQRNPEMVRLLMQAGANARKGVWPHRDATTAHTLAHDRTYDEIVAIIEEWEQDRREAMSCPNATISPAQERLHAAIRAGDPAGALAILEADPSLVHACDRDGASPLHAAAFACSEALVAWLLDRGASVRKNDAKGLTALDRAALAVDPRNDKAERFPAVARLLLGRGASVTLRAAVALGDAERVRELVRRDPAVLEAREGLLSLAVKHARPDVVRLLMQLGADVDERITLADLEQSVVSWGQPLWLAARAGHLEIAQLLLDGGADPNANLYASGWPIDHAYARRNEPLKRLLLSRGAKPRPWTVTLVHDVDEARRMLSADASEELANDFVFSACLNGCPAILEAALPRLAWPPDDARWHWILIQPIRGHDRAEHAGLFGCMTLLLARGVDVNVRDGRGSTVLHYTAADGDPAPVERARFVHALLDAGARVDLRDDLFRSTPLGWAARWGRREMVEALLGRGAPANEPAAEPWATPLAWAAKRGHAEIAELLRNRGARA
jgi:ankyrin repeat protein